MRGRISIEYGFSHYGSGFSHLWCCQNVCYTYCWVSRAIVWYVVGYVTFEWLWNTVPIYWWNELRILCQNAVCYLCGVRWSIKYLSLNTQSDETFEYKLILLCRTLKLGTLAEQQLVGGWARTREYETPRTMKTNFLDKTIKSTIAVRGRAAVATSARIQIGCKHRNCGDSKFFLI